MDRESLEFLPAALEIVETPPSPIGRLIAFVSAILFCLALLWACLGRLDIIASATGKIVLRGCTDLAVPHESRLEIEAMIQGQDVAFVHSGQSVKIKVDGLNYNVYGQIDGQVVSILADVIIDERQPDKSRNVGQSAGSELNGGGPSGQRLFYAARVSLARDKLQVGDKLINLSPGMAVTVEIATGSRAIISYLLFPLFRFEEDAPVDH